MHDPRRANAIKEKKDTRVFLAANNRNTLHTTHTYTRIHGSYDTLSTSPTSNRLRLSYTDSLA